MDEAWRTGRRASAVAGTDRLTAAAGRRGTPTPAPSPSSLPPLLAPPGTLESMIYNRQARESVWMYVGVEQWLAPAPPPRQLLMTAGSSARRSQATYNPSPSLPNTSTLTAPCPQVYKEQHSKMVLEGEAQPRIWEGALSPSLPPCRRRRRRRLPQSPACTPPALAAPSPHLCSAPRRPPVLARPGLAAMQCRRQDGQEG